MKSIARNVGLLILFSTGSLGLQSCELYEVCFESSFNEILSDTWLPSYRKSDIEDEAADDLFSTFEDDLEAKVKAWGGTLVEMEVDVYAGSSAPTLDVQNLTLSSSSSQMCTDFDWRIHPEWSGSGAKVTITGTFNYWLTDHDFTLTLKNIELAGTGTWQVLTPKGGGADSATTSQTGAVCRGDAKLVIDGSTVDSWEEISADLGKILVRALILDPIKDENGW